MRYIFGDCVLDPARRELKRDDTAVHLQPQVFDLLLHLVRNHSRVVSKDELLSAVWHGRVVSESTLSSRINAARRAIGDSGSRQQHILTVARKGIRFLGDVATDPLHQPQSDAPGEPGRESGRKSGQPFNAVLPMRPSQEVTFVRAADGAHLAVAMSGDGEPVVKTANWLNHIEYDWHSPVWSPTLRHLATRFRLVRYDERGNGLSDWNVADISFEAFVRDLETVVDAVGLERFALFGISQGAAVAIAYAARHPERVSRLVLCGGYALGWRRRGGPEEVADGEALLTLIRNGWGRDNPAFRQTFTSLLVPDATDDQARAFNELERQSTSPENAARLTSAFGDIDVVDQMPLVAAPTLVIHSRHDDAVPFEQGRLLARTIPNARFLALDSRNHLLLAHEPAWRRYMEEVCDFLGGETDKA